MLLHIAKTHLTCGGRRNKKYCFQIVTECEDQNAGKEKEIIDGELVLRMRLFSLTQFLVKKAILLALTSELRHQQAKTPKRFNVYTGTTYMLKW